MSFIPQDPDFAVRVRNSFSRQSVMQTMEVELVSVEAGRVVLAMPFNSQWTQQHGFLHAGVVSTVMDSACGYAAFSLMPAEAAVLSIEFKTNLLRPAQGERFEFVGQVKKAGKTITIVDGEAYAFSGNQKKLIATMTGTMMTVLDKGLSG